MLMKMKLRRYFLVVSTVAMFALLASPALVFADEDTQVVSEEFTPFMVTSAMPCVEPGSEGESTPGMEGEGEVIEGSAPIEGSTDEPVIEEPIVIDEETVFPGDEPLVDPGSEIESKPIDVEDCSFMYDVVPLPCEDGQEDCIQPYYRTTTVDDPLVLTKTTDTSEDGDNSVEMNLAAGSAEDSETVNSDVNTVNYNLAEENQVNALDAEAAMSLTYQNKNRTVSAMPKTGEGGDNAPYTLYASSALALLLVAFVIYRKRNRV